MTEEQKSRYARHLVLDGIREEGQEKLLSSRVLVIGSGGLGASAMYLAAAGVGTIGLVDDDCVESSNLQRQIQHSEKAVGEKKVFSAARRLKEINSSVRLELYPMRVTPDNITELIKGYDFVLDCTDRFANKFLINDACVITKTPFCHAGVLSWGGQVMTVLPGHACLRCLIGEVPSSDETALTKGVLGAVVGVISNLQAIEAVKYIVGAGELLTDRVLTFDALRMKTKVINFGVDPNCRVCGTHPDILTLKGNAAEYRIRK